MSQEAEPWDHHTEHHEACLIAAGDELKAAMHRLCLHRRPDDARALFHFAAGVTDQRFHTVRKAFRACLCLLGGRRGL